MDSRCKGSLTVIVGAMFAGKAEELIRRVRRALYAGRRVQVFKHALDTRSDGTESRSHSGVLYEAGAVSTSGELLESVEPFGPMPALLAEADGVVKLRAICARCGRDASRSQRLIDGKPALAFAPTILVGAQESYEARCRHCHEV